MNNSTVISYKSDPFWYEEPYIIIQKNRLTEFFPCSDQTLSERFNALVRLGLYCSVILYYYHKDIKYFGILIGALLLTYFVYTNSPKENIKKIISNELEHKTDELEYAPVENLENEKCTKPTLDNPFMNVTMKDFMNINQETQAIVDRPPACDTTDPDVKQSMDEMFNHNLFKDVNDVFGKINSQRQFYTMPSTTIPNAQDEFARWLYLNPKTCKEDQEFCLRYEDIRAKRPVFVDPTKNPEMTKK